MANQYKNKVIYNGATLIDLTEDTITPDVLKNGITAHDKTGALITGTCQFFPLDPLVYDYNIGYIAAGVWIYENPTNTYIDIYEVLEGCNYHISLGNNVGTRFRAMFTTVDITKETEGRIAGTQIVNLNNPASYASTNFDCVEDGYILVAKDNVGKSGIKSYVINRTLGFA